MFHNKRKTYVRIFLVTLLVAVWSTCFYVVGLTSEPITLTIWRPPFHTDPAAEDAFMTKLNNKFEKENPGVKVELVMVPWDELMPKYAAAVESKTTPDISIGGATHCMALVPSGMVLPATDLIREIGEDDFYTTLLPYIQWKGETWLIPQIHSARILYYNKKHFLEAGLDPNKPPTNWDELVEDAKKLTRAGRYGFGALYSRDYLPSQHLLMFMVQAGGGMREGETVIIDSKENAVGLQFYADLYLKHKVVAPGAVAATEMMCVEDFASGRTSMGIFDQGWAGAWRDQLPQERFSEFGYAPLPEGPNGGKASFGCNDGGWIWTTCKHVDIAKEWLKFWLRDDNMQEWIEMTSYMSPLKHQNEKWMSMYKEQPWRIAATAMFPYLMRWGYPGGGHPADGIIETSFIFSDMLQEVVVKKRPVDEVLTEYQKKFEELYSSYK